MFLIWSDSSVRAGHVKVVTRDVGVDIRVQQLRDEGAAGGCRISGGGQHALPVLVTNVGVAVPGEHRNHQLPLVL